MRAAVTALAYCAAAASALRDGATHAPTSLPNVHKQDRGLYALVDLLITLAVILCMLWLLSLVIRMTQVHLDEPPRPRVRDAAFTKEGQRWNWDFVLLLPIRDEDQLADAIRPPELGFLQDGSPRDEFVRHYSLLRVVSAIRSAGLETSVFKSQRYDHAIVKVRATAARLRKAAAQTGFVAKLKDEAVRQRLAKGVADEDAPGEYKIYPRRDDWRYKGAPMDTAIRDTEGQSNYLYYEHCYGPFVDEETMEKLYARHVRSESPFRGVDRIKLIMSMLAAPARDGGAGLPLDKLVRRRAAAAAFPLHDEDELKTIEQRWIVMWQRPGKVPAHRICEYFGEKIAFYFLFLAHATSFFAFAGLVGIGVWINTLVSPKAENAVTVPYFCAFMGMWATCFVEDWKRKQSRHAMEWGAVGFEDVEGDRPEFAEDALTLVTNSPVDGMPTTYFPVETARKRRSESAAVIFVAIVAVCIVVYAIFLLNVTLRLPVVAREIDPKTWWKKLPSVDLRPAIIGVISTIQILVLEHLWLLLAERMTDREGHRTDTEYEDALIAKTFVFTFVNAYASFFYTAFFKQLQASVDGAGLGFPANRQRLFACEPDNTGVANCMYDLRVQLSSIFITRVLFTTTMDVIPPYLSWKRERLLARDERARRKSRATGVHEDDEPEDAAVAYARKRQLGNRIFGGLFKRRSSSGPTGAAPEEETKVESSDDSIRGLDEEPERIPSAAEEECGLGEYHVMLGPFRDYAQLIIIYGFGVLFVAAYPLAPLLAAVNSYVQIRVGGWRLSQRRRRTWPAGAEDIGTWEAIVDIMSYLAVIVNGLLLTVTGQFFVNHPWWARAAIFVGFTHGLLLAKFTLALAVPDAPSEVRLQIARQEFVRDKLVARLPDATPTVDLQADTEDEYVDLTILDADEDELY